MKKFILLTILLLVWACLPLLAQNNSIVSFKETINNKEYFIFQDEELDLDEVCKDCVSLAKLERITILIKETFSEEALKILETNRWSIHVRHKNDSIIYCRLQFSNISEISEKDIRNLFAKLKSEKLVRCMDNSSENGGYWGVLANSLLKQKGKVRDEW